VTDPREEYKGRPAKFVCNTCCENGKLRTENGTVIFECPEHMTLVIFAGAVISATSHGTRQ